MIWISHNMLSLLLPSINKLYLLAQLKKQGLGVSTMDQRASKPPAAYRLFAMDYIFNAIVLNEILYSLPVYFGYLTEDQKQMLQRVLNRANRRGFTPYCHYLDTLAESAQHDLFRHSRHSAHCLKDQMQRFFYMVK